jgi:hypothetical protein
MSVERQEKPKWESNALTTPWDIQNKIRISDLGINREEPSAARFKRGGDNRSRESTVEN